MVDKLCKLTMESSAAGAVLIAESNIDSLKVTSADSPSLRDMISRSLEDDKLRADRERESEATMLTLQTYCNSLLTSVECTNALLAKLDSKIESLKFQNLLLNSLEVSKCKTSPSQYPIETLGSRPIRTNFGHRAREFVEPLTNVRNSGASKSPIIKSLAFPDSKETGSVRVVEFEKGFASVSHGDGAPCHTWTSNLENKASANASAGATESLALKLPHQTQTLQSETNLEIAANVERGLPKLERVAMIAPPVKTINIKRSTTQQTVESTSAAIDPAPKPSAKVEQTTMTEPSTETRVPANAKAASHSVQRSVSTSTKARESDFLRLPWEQDRARHRFLRQILELEVMKMEKLCFSENVIYKFVEALVALREKSNEKLSSLLQLEKSFGLDVHSDQLVAELERFNSQGKLSENVGLAQAGTYMLAIVSAVDEGLVPQSFYIEALQVNPGELSEADLKAEMSGWKLRVWNLLVSHFSNLLGYSLLVQQRAAQQRCGLGSRESAQNFLVANDLAFIISDIALARRYRAHEELNKAQWLLEQMALVRAQNLPNAELEQLFVSPENSLLLSCVSTVPITQNDAFTVGPCVASLLASLHSNPRAYLFVVAKLVIEEITRPNSESLFIASQSSSESTLTESVISRLLLNDAEQVVSFVAVKLINDAERAMKGSFEKSDASLCAELAEKVYAHLNEYLYSLELSENLAHTLAYARHWCRLHKRDRANAFVRSLFISGVISAGLYDLTAEDVQIHVLKSSVVRVTQIVHGVAGKLREQSIEKNQPEIVLSVERQLAKILEDVAIDSPFLDSSIQSRQSDSFAIPRDILLRTIQSFLLRIEPAVTAKLLQIVQSYHQHFFELKNGESEGMAARITAQNCNKRSRNFQFFRRVLEEKALSVRLSRSSLSLNRL